MEELINWLTGTTLGLIILGLMIGYLIKRNLSNNEVEESTVNKRKTRNKIKEKTIIITETKTTKIKNLDKESYEKIINRDSNRTNNDVSN